MNKNCPIITIDGPGGTGKGTVGQRLASKLGWHFLDSGVLYRALGLAAVKHSVALDDEAALVVLAATLDIRFVADRILFEDHDVSLNIRIEETGAIASKISAFPAVRAALLERQRAFAKPPGLVTDGRDMGTVIFPQADLKIFLSASVEERARRRQQQLKEKGITATIADLVLELGARDERDQQRAVAPLVPAADALIIDTTHLSVEAVLEQVLQEVKKKVGLL